MTDSEIICTFMERRPKSQDWGRDRLDDYQAGAIVGHRPDSPRGWWRFAAYQQGVPLFDNRPLTLNECREVEARLTHAQVGLYIQELYRVTLSPDGVGRQDWRLLHATAEQKITALAAVLRAIVEQTEASPSAKECI